ncbi:hypothetical protein [Subtercola lobariae]|uniref:hypothetical protein n=1 Tax=Subtercola lobariae TaxID=1588641 RepID=UPI001668B32D|nr:hypothetical protein [Subtercola lobariae]
MSDGIVSFDNNNDTSTVPVVKSDGSVEITTVIDNANAPATYAYPITVHGGGSVALNDDGTVSILNADGNWVAGIAPAWAKDATGGAVPTHYTVDGVGGARK